MTNGEDRGCFDVIDDEETSEMYIVIAVRDQMYLLTRMCAIGMHIVEDG